MLNLSVSMYLFSVGKLYILKTQLTLVKKNDVFTVGQQQTYHWKASNLDPNSVCSLGGRMSCQTIYFVCYFMHLCASWYSSGGKWRGMYSYLYIPVKATACLIYSGCFFFPLHDFPQWTCRVITVSVKSFITQRDDQWCGYKVADGKKAFIVYCIWEEAADDYIV